MTLQRSVRVDGAFSLAATCSPVEWAGGRWPNEDWRDSSLIWCGSEQGRAVWRQVRQLSTGELSIIGTASADADARWAAAVLGADRHPPDPDDPVLSSLADRFAGLRMHAAGSVYEGLVSSIVGQSITVKSAAVTLTRIAQRGGVGLELHGRTFWPIPDASTLRGIDLAALRATGLTMRRAEALHAVADAELSGRLPTRALALDDPERVIAGLRSLPLVGPWTAASALIWGVGMPDVHPSGDVALLRAARQVYNAPALTLRELDVLADRWRPHRGWAARWLWTALLGTPS